MSFNVILAAILVTSLASPVWAQLPESPEKKVEDIDWGERYKEAEIWIVEYTKYKDWENEWLNRPKTGKWKRYAERKIAPDPPVWLHGSCLNLNQPELVLLLEWEERNKKYAGSDNSFNSMNILQRACALVIDWRDDLGTNNLRRQTMLARQEKSRNTLFRLTTHLDTMHIRSESEGGVYSPLGMHVTIVDAWNRLQVFGPPGVMWVKIRNANGNYDSKFGYTWGFSIRLFNFTVPGIRRPVSTHANVVKCWIPGGNGTASNNTGGNNGINMIGISMARKKD